MRRIPVRSSDDKAHDKFAQPYRPFDEFERENPQANSAEEVISEMGLVLVIMLGIVVAINMALLALHVS